MVYPKVVKSVHYCPTTGRTMERRYTDMTSYDPFPSSSVYPVKVGLIIIILYHDRTFLVIYILNNL